MRSGWREGAGCAHDDALQAVILRRRPKKFSHVGVEILRSADSAQDDGKVQAPLRMTGGWDSVQDGGRVQGALTMTGQDDASG